MAREERQYTDKNLYGADSLPHAADIRQDDIYNCYFLAPMGSLGEQQPDRIRDAISFNAETGEFTVALYRPPSTQERSQGRTDPIRESIVVSQEDIRRNIDRGGGGTVDNNRRGDGPLWPTVIEAGFAELYGRDAQGQVNLGRGYRTIGDSTGGGGLADGMYALTGESGRNLRIINPDAPPMRPTGPDHVQRSEPPPYRAPLHGARVQLDTAYAEVEQALAANRSVSMATQGRDVRDGLEQSHAYMVVGLSRDPRTNEALITLRNPYGHNQFAQEGNQNIGAGWTTDNPEITVNLNRLVRDGSFAEFNIGPAARVQTQQQGAPAPAQGAPVQPAPAQPAQAEPQPPAPSPPGALSITDRNHPGHERFQQALTAIERSPNIPAGALTGERLQQSAANLAYASLAGAQRPQGGQNERLDRIDFVVFNNDRSGLIAGQGELGNPTAKLALLPGAQDSATSLAQASQQVHSTLAQQQSQTPSAAQQPSTQTPDDPTPKGPRV
ncbi:XVIPCD domain-containing protein [Pseudomonas sp. CGJS7]|uniref:XVIPCD domain-containing protein n=1 Tax=Pseudomonas sp. CGJS7 TaxID=3109348 RepID=UPI00300AC426